ncbi:transposase [Streptomyces sp. SID11385]|uniref:transposase n=1 Tax=Streptomyces sp. SID11385 TaxID=2706031 RepID=UPI0013C84B65|nr:transposase [Streptomyces sp. SID11385]NEA44164.1 transposase [Streptomyces sp. SID11385]
MLPTWCYFLWNLKIPVSRYPRSNKRDAIALVNSSGKTVTAVARELGISSESLRGWFRKAKAD